MSTYHPDPSINNEIIEDSTEAELADLAAGYPPKRWRCPKCETVHGRGHFMTFCVHRCLRCGYVGMGGVMFVDEGRAGERTAAA